MERNWENSRYVLDNRRRLFSSCLGICMADTQVPVKEFEYDQFVHAALESEEQVKQEE